MCKAGYLFQLSSKVWLRIHVACVVAACYGDATAMLAACQLRVVYMWDYKYGSKRKKTSKATRKVAVLQTIVFFQWRFYLVVISASSEVHIQHTKVELDSAADVAV